jgi:LysM repeat protein
MSTPSPLVPQGSIQDAPKGRRNLPVLVFSVIGFHVAVLGVALMIGCKPETTKTADPLAQFSETNAVAPLVTDASTTTGNAAPTTNPYELPPAPTPAPGTSIGGTPAPSPAPAPGYGTVPPPIGGAPAPTPTPGGYEAPGTFVDSAAPAVEPASSSMTEHKVKSGDTFGKMAKEYGVSTKAIVAANPNIDPRRLKVGQNVLIPAPSRAAAAPSASARSTGSPSSSSSSTGIYVVKAGDSLTRIASQHGTSVKALKSLNGLKTDRINVGQKLKVPVKSAPEPEPTPAPVAEPLPISPAFGTSPSTVPVPQPVR